MKPTTKKPPKQNSFLRFFKVLGRVVHSLPQRIKRNSTLACAVLIALGILLASVTMPVPAAPKEETPEETATTEATQPATVENKHIISSVPVVVQDYYRAGCETYACVMLLKGLGFNIDEHTFVEKYLILKDFSYDDQGNMYGPDMNSAFAGDIFTGAGIFSPAMAKSMNSYLKTQNTPKQAYSIKGKTLAQLCDEYISKDIPVMTWVTTYMEESYDRFTWIVNYVDENAEHKIGDMQTWRQNEHCMVLVGYSDKDYYFCDSVAGKLVAHEKTLAETRFKEIGNQAVVVK